MRPVLRVLGTDPGVIDPAEGRRLLPPGKPYALLCLASLTSAGVSRDELAALLWPATVDAKGRASVRQALHVARRVIGPEGITEEVGRIALRSESLGIDLDELASALREGDLVHAHALWQGGPFAHFSLADAPGFNDWADGVRTQWERRVGETLTERGAQARAAGRPEEALQWLQRALDVRPFDESSHAEAIDILLELGHLDRAAEALERARAVVDEPTPGIFEGLESRVRAARRARIAEPAAEVSPSLHFVGRTREMAELRSHWKSALSGRPRVVALLGEAGIGKSRLAREFVVHTAGQDATVAQAKAVDTERALPLGTVAELVKALSALPGAAGIANASLSMLRQLVPTLGNGTQTALPHAPLSEVAVAEAILDLVEAVAHEGPVVLLVEDLQWADAASRAILLRVLHSLKGAQVLSVITCRSGDADLSALHALRAEAESGRCTTLTLAPLSPAEIHEALTLTLDVQPPEDGSRVADLLARSSRGNPFFLAELVRRLQEDGHVTCDEEGWVLHGAGVDAVAVPGSIREILEARLLALPEEARRSVAALAWSDTPVTPVEVGQRAEIPPDVQSQVLSLLVAQGLVVPTDEGRLLIGHDLLRETAQRLLPRPHAHTLRRKRGRWIALAAAAVTAVGLGLRLLGGGGAPPLPLSGGGLLLVERNGMLGLLEIPEDAQREWHWRPVLAATNGTLSAGFYSDPAGILAFANMQDASGRSVSYRIRSGAAPKEVVPHDGDVSTLSVSPAGRELVLGMAHEAPRPWHHDIVRYDPATGMTHRVYEPQITAHTTWLPDRSALVLVPRSDPDTLIVLRPDGEVLQRRVIPGTKSDAATSVCGPRAMLLAVTSPDAAPRLLLAPLDSTVSVTWLEPAAPYLDGHRCSPGGTAMAFLGLVEGQRRLLLQDLATGDTLLGPPGVERVLQWTSTDPDPLPLAVQARPANLRIEWGASVRPVASVHFSNGSTRSDTLIRWRSLDPNVAYVADDGTVWGVGGGTTRLIASVHGWMNDTVEVTVDAARIPSEALLADRFETLDPHRWTVFGAPRPQPASQDGLRVLDMRGDGVGADGIASTARYRLPSGATLELEFHLPLTRKDRQAIVVCLAAFASAGVVPTPDAPPTQQVCFMHPASELASFDPSSFRLTGVVSSGRQSRPDILPSRGWTRAALVLAPDGQGRLLLDGVEVARLPVPMTMDPDFEWGVTVYSRAADTRLLIRDLVLWEGMRY